MRFVPLLIGFLTLILSNSDVHSQAVMYPIRVKSSNVWARVVKFSGDIRITAKVDSDQNQFWSNVQLIGRTITMPENKRASSYIYTIYQDPNLGNKSTEFTGKILMNPTALKQIDDSVNETIQSDFNALKTLVARPVSGNGDEHATALKNFVHKDINNISLQVSPLSSPWSVSFQLFTYESGSLEVIQETYLDQSIGTQSPTIRLNIENTGP